MDGFLFDNIQAKNRLLKVPLKTQIRYDNATFDSDGSGLPLYLQLQQDSWDSQLVINDCTVNELLYQLFEANALKLSVKSEMLTTSLLQLIGGFTKVFGAGQPCMAIVSLGGDEAPKIKINKNGYFEIDTTPLDLEIRCLPSNATSNKTEDYLYATTLNLDMSTKFNISLGYDVLIKANFINSDDILLNYIGYDKEGPVKINPKFVVGPEIQIVSGVINESLKTIFNHGLSLNNIFQNTTLCWLDIRQIYFVPDYDLSYLWGALSIGYWTEMCPGEVPWGEWSA